MYSNTGFILAGVILRRAAGESVASAMRRELFRAPGGDGLAMKTAERPRANLSIAITWNDDELNDTAPFLTSLLRAALGRR